MWPCWDHIGTMFWRRRAWFFCLFWSSPAGGPARRRLVGDGEEHLFNVDLDVLELAVPQGTLDVTLPFNFGSIVVTDVQHVGLGCRRVTLTAVCSRSSTSNRTGGNRPACWRNRCQTASPPLRRRAGSCCALAPEPFGGADGELAGVEHIE